MSNKIKDNDLNKVSGGQGEYNSIIEDINNIKQKFINLCHSIQSNSYYDRIINHFDECSKQLSGNNAAAAKSQLSSITSTLRSLASTYPGLEPSFTKIIKLLNDISLTL